MTVTHLNSLLRVIEARNFWTCWGERNVTGTLPHGSPVLGIIEVYYCIIHDANREFSFPLYDSVRGVGDKGCTSVTIIVFPSTMVSSLANQRDCGNTLLPRRSWPARKNLEVLAAASACLIG